MEHTHVCEDCGEEYFEPFFYACMLCHGDLLEQTVFELESEQWEKNLGRDERG